MGQEQSAVASSTAPRAAPRPLPPPDDGVRVVHASGSALSTVAADGDVVDRALAQSAALPLPQPVLPPPPVKDDVASALQGAAMMHELRTLLGGWLPNRDSPLPPSSIPPAATTAATDSVSPAQSQQAPAISASVATDARSSTPTDASADSDSRATPDASPNDNNKSKGEKREEGIEPLAANQENVAQSQLPQAPPKNASPQAVRAEQDAWKRVAVDPAALEAVLTEITGGERMAALVDQQAVLMSRLRQLAKLADELKASVDSHVEQAKASSRMSDRVDRLKMSFGDVQDVLEQSVATANILGAAHFPDDEEMCSFKNFLKHHPPRQQ